MIMSVMSAMMGRAGCCVFTLEKHRSLCEGGVREDFLEEVMSMMIPNRVNQPKQSMAGVGSECFKPKE